VISYPLRGMDDDLWYAAKARAAADRLTVKDIIVMGLQLYVQQGLGAFEKVSKPRLTVATTRPKAASR
jgi:hypothetical protein